MRGNHFALIISRCLTVGYNQLRKIHVYNNAPINSQDLAVELTKNIYNHEGIIVLNKPAGISFSNPSLVKPAKGKVTERDYEVTLTSLLPYLKEILDTPSLYLIKAPEKYISGVSIFCTDEELSGIVKKQLLKMRESCQPPDTYVALVLGKPQEAESCFNGAVTLKSQKNSKEKKVMITPEWSRNSIRNGITKRVTIAHKTLLSTEDVSLVEVSSTRNTWHCVRMYLASKLLTPVIGDNLFGSRVKSILGMPVALDVFSAAAQLPQKLPNDVLKRLELASRQDVSVPLQIHLSGVKVNHLLKKGHHVSFDALPPYTFLWTCHKLGLEEGTLLTEKGESYV